MALTMAQDGFSSPRPVIHRAKVVWAITRPAIEDGAVVVAEGVILAVDGFRMLRRQWPMAQVYEHDGAILPALVNSHTHLDLSGLFGQVQAEGGMAAWIKRLIAVREGTNTGQVMGARNQALISSRSHGTGILGDIRSSAPLMEKATETVTLTFVEVFGLHVGSLQTALGSLPASVQQELTNGSEGVSLAAHSPYTASATLIKEVKGWGSVRGRVVCIHAAESEEETLFLHTGQGPLRDLLDERGMEPGRWHPPGCGAVTYLQRLGVLDPLTLCVHAVQVSREEIHLLEQSGASVCLCPRSNLFIGHGLPPVESFLEAGVRCALGTDSLASNHDLNLFKEMAVLMDSCGIGPETVLKMGTMNGAHCLGMANLYGSLEQGKRWLAIRVAGGDGEGIVAAGCQGKVEWIG